MHYIIPTATIIIASEIIRKVLLAQNTKPTKVITFVIMVLIDLALYANIYDITNFSTFVETLGFTFFASIACNLMYNYVSSRYGCIPIVIYRLITILYVYFIPIIPNVYMFFRSILRTIYPYILFQIISFTFENKKVAVAYTNKRKALIGKILMCGAALMITGLVSCEFTYGLLVIGSGSMTGTINKGDAMIYARYNGKDEIKEGDIVMFVDNGRQIVHRVIEARKVNGIDRYITKGDANLQQDEGHITKDQIIGRYILRVPYMGYPSLWLRDIFAN